MKKLFLLLSVLFITSYGFSQVTLKGNIQVDKNGRPLPSIVIGDSIYYVSDIAPLPVSASFLMDSSQSRKVLSIDNFKDSTKVYATRINKIGRIDTIGYGHTEIIDATGAEMDLMKDADQWVQTDHALAVMGIDTDSKYRFLRTTTAGYLRVSNDSTSQAYENRLYEQSRGISTDTSLIYSDTIGYNTNNVLKIIDSTSNKRIIIDFISINTDSLTTGFEIKYGIAGNKLMFRNNALTGNASVIYNFIGSPMVLPTNASVYARRWVQTGVTAASKGVTYLTIKYRLK